LYRIFHPVACAPTINCPHSFKHLEIIPAGKTVTIIEVKTFSPQFRTRGKLENGKWISLRAFDGDKKIWAVPLKDNQDLIDDNIAAKSLNYNGTFHFQ
jgi:hypothetical protein